MASNFCPQCGASMQQAASFCVMCGFKFAAKQAAPVQAPATLKERVAARCTELGIPDYVMQRLHIEEDSGEAGAIGIANRSMFLFTYKNVSEGVHTFLYFGTSQEDALKALEKELLEAAAAPAPIPAPAPNHSAPAAPFVPVTAFELPDLPAPMPVAGVKEEAPLEDADPAPAFDEPTVGVDAPVPMPVADEPDIVEINPMPVVDLPDVAEPVPVPAIDEPDINVPVPLPVIDLPEIDMPEIDVPVPMPVIDMPEDVPEEAPAAPAVPETAPRTMEELAAWYNAAGLPPFEESRFYIGDTDALSVFGIRADGGEFEVFRNKHDGTRKVFYRGTDEANAVSGFYNTIRQRMGLADASQFAAKKAIEN